MFTHRLLPIYGATAFALGAAVYLTDRAAHDAAIFGVLGQWLPSFVHPLAFSLFTAAAGNYRRPYCACVAWWAVNVLFEFAQHPRVALMRGTFDAGDLVAVTLGAIVAACLLRMGGHK